jgi:hypothetical protein
MERRPRGAGALEGLGTAGVRQASWAIRNRRSDPNHRATTVWHTARMPDEHSLELESDVETSIIQSGFAFACERPSVSRRCRPSRAGISMLSPRDDRNVCQRCAIPANNQRYRGGARESQVRIGLVWGSSCQAVVFGFCCQFFVRSGKGRSSFFNLINASVIRHGQDAHHANKCGCSSAIRRAPA